MNIKMTNLKSMKSIFIQNNEKAFLLQKSLHYIYSTNVQQTYFNKKPHKN